MQIKTNREGRVLVAILVLVAMGGLTYLAVAGDTEPSAPPGATMRTLEEVYDAVNATSAGISERENYCRYFNFGSSTGYTEILTVEGGKRLVILQMFVLPSDGWVMYVDDEVFLVCKPICYDSTSTPTKQMWDFPDRCVVVDGGQTLKLLNPGGNDHWIQIIGYFYDVP